MKTKLFVIKLEVTYYLGVCILYQTDNFLLNKGVTLVIFILPGKYPVVIDILHVKKCWFYCMNAYFVKATVSICF